MIIVPKRGQQKEEREAQKKNTQKKKWACKKGRKQNDENDAKKGT